MVKSHPCVWAWFRYKKPNLTHEIQLYYLIKYSLSPCLIFSFYLQSRPIRLRPCFTRQEGRCHRKQQRCVVAGFTDFRFPVADGRLFATCLSCTRRFDPVHTNLIDRDSACNFWSHNFFWECILPGYEILMKWAFLCAEVHLPTKSPVFASKTSSSLPREVPLLVMSFSDGHIAELVSPLRFKRSRRCSILFITLRCPKFICLSSFND